MFKWSWHLRRRFRTSRLSLAPRRAGRMFLYQETTSTASLRLRLAVSLQPILSRDRIALSRLPRQQDLARLTSGSRSSADRPRLAVDFAISRLPRFRTRLSRLRRIPPQTRLGFRCQAMRLHRLPSPRTRLTERPPSMGRRSLTRQTRPMWGPTVSNIPRQMRQEPRQRLPSRLRWQQTRLLLRPPR